MNLVCHAILPNACRNGLAVTVAIATFAGVCIAQTPDLRIAVIDLYGLNRIAPSAVRDVLTFKEGDPISLREERLPMFTESEQRLKEIPGIVRVRFSTICCDTGGAVVTVGIEERGSPTLRFRRAPGGDVRLPNDVLEAGAQFEQAIQAAVSRGDSSEDHAQGHALAHDPAARAIQERFIVFANRDLHLLRSVLAASADSRQRALAAYVLGYVRDKTAVIGGLVHATTDPSEEVRNNAARTLWVFMNATSAIRVPYDPFVKMLHSPVWSDRNKASLALLALSDKRDPALFELLRRRALGPLVEIARWNSEGHALPGFILLSRMAGYSDDDARRLWNAGHRETIIVAATGQR